MSTYFLILINSFIFLIVSFWSLSDIKLSISCHAHFNLYKAPISWTVLMSTLFTLKVVREPQPSDSHQTRNGSMTILRLLLGCCSLPYRRLHQLLKFKDQFHIVHLYNTTNPPCLLSRSVTVCDTQTPPSYRRSCTQLTTALQFVVSSLSHSDHIVITCRRIAKSRFSGSNLQRVLPL